MEKAYINIADKALSVSGVTSVISVYDKEVVLMRGEQRISISGVGITAEKLEMGAGMAEFSFESLNSVVMGNRKKFSFSNLFK